LEATIWLSNTNFKKATIKFIDIEVSGEVKHGGYEVIGHIEHTPNGNIVTGIGGHEVPKEFYEIDMYCDHCKSKRNRNYIYILQDEKGQYYKVGGSCVKEFTDGLKPEWIAKVAEYIQEVKDSCTPSGDNFTAYYDTQKLLKYACGYIQKFGYKQRMGRTVFDVYLAKEAYDGSKIHDSVLKDVDGIDFDSQEIQDCVANQIEYAKSQKDSNNYFHNLYILCTAKSYASSGKLNILASLFCKMTTPKVEDKVPESKSQYQGTVGAKMKISIVTSNVVTSWISDFGYGGTMTYLYKFTDSNGNIYTWKTGKEVDFTNTSIEAKVKAHTEYNHEKQTEIFYCKAI
jgi:hypothetical protein